MFTKKLGTYYNPDVATIFLVKDVTASQGSQKQEKGEKVPDRLGFLFLVGTRGKFGENSGTSIFTTPGN